jgi:hypothetical protein
MNEVSCSQSRVDGSMIHVSCKNNVTIRENWMEDEVVISIITPEIKNINHEKYLKEFWQFTLLDFYMPKKKNISELYILIEHRLQLGYDYFDWSFARDEQGCIEKLVLISEHGPESGKIEYYETCIQNAKEYLYQFNLIDIGKIIFYE